MMPHKSKGQLRVAIVCDWMLGGGAEQVVEQIAGIFPTAPIYTSYCSPEWRERLGKFRVRTGILQHWPLSKLRKFIPFLRIWWFTRLRLDGYDLVISSSGAEAKGIRLGNSSSKLGISGTKKPISNFQLPVTKPLHVAYIHAPTHYYWRRYDEYLREPGFGIFNPLARLGLRILVGPLRKWDFKAAQRPDHMIANSSHTQQMIKQYYQRDSTVIFPPVDVEKFSPTTHSSLPTTKRSGFIVVGRQTPYKRIDLAVAACTKLKLQLTVVGNGPEHKKLLGIAGPTITFLKNISEDEKISLLQRHEAFIFPNEDDFGIAAVEAMAAGCPVIALRAGGALDTVKPDVSGDFFDEPTVDFLVSTLKKFDPSKFSPARVAKHAEQFSRDNFQQKISKLINQTDS